MTTTPYLHDHNVHFAGASADDAGSDRPDEFDSRIIRRTDGPLSGSTVILTGAGSGLGLHITRQLLGSGARVIANYSRSADGLAAMVDEVPADRLIPVQGDIREEETSVQLCRVAAGHGGPDAVIHNAGATRDGLLVTMKAADWDETHQVNLRGAFFLTKHAVRKMMPRKHGRFVYISSVSASTGNEGQTNYSSSKSGLDGLARSVAQEYYRYNIGAVVLAVGIVDIGMSSRMDADYRRKKLDRLLAGGSKPEHIASIASFLCQPEAVAINATVIKADGGLKF
jgi:3-oxoacyl-[acyl-carrier protein] reductase